MGNSESEPAGWLARCQRGTSRSKCTFSVEWLSRRTYIEVHPIKYSLCVPNYVKWHPSLSLLDMENFKLSKPCKSRVLASLHVTMRMHGVLNRDIVTKLWMSAIFLASWSSLHDFGWCWRVGACSGVECGYLCVTHCLPATL